MAKDRRIILSLSNSGDLTMTMEYDHDIPAEYSGDYFLAILEVTIPQVKGWSAITGKIGEANDPRLSHSTFQNQENLAIIAEIRGVSEEALKLIQDMLPQLSVTMGLSRKSLMSVLLAKNQ